MNIRTFRRGRQWSRSQVMWAALLGLACVVPAAAAEPSSSAAARELARVLDAAKLDSIAAVDPADPETFVAALYFPGSQLLVVSAKYVAPTLLLTKIAEKNYRDVYIDLNSASVAGTKVFVIDQGVDGIAPRPEDGQAPDSYENGAAQLNFDGEWRKAKISQDEYMKKFAAADERYAQMLSVLIAAAKPSTNQSRALPLISR